MRNFFLIFILFCNSLFAEIPEPYRSINELPFDPHGWFGNADQLDMLLRDREINTVVEVGSWLGSTRHIASLLGDNGILYAVDTWAGSPQEAVHMTDLRLPFLYQQFLSNVIHAKLTDKIVPIRMNSVEAAKALNVKADLIYLDGAHDTVSVMNDIDHWLPHLKADGLICGDDWLWPTVRAAVENRAYKYNKKVYSIHNFWWYE